VKHCSLTIREYIEGFREESSELRGREQKHGKKYKKWVLSFAPFTIISIRKSGRMDRRFKQTREMINAHKSLVGRP
jgi:hypothetical protein